MRTTVNLDADVLAILKATAERERMTLGQAISKIVRDSLTRPHKDPSQKYDLPLVREKRPGVLLTSDMVKRAAEDE